MKIVLAESLLANIPTSKVNPKINGDRTLITVHTFSFKNVISSRTLTREGPQVSFRILCQYCVQHRFVDFCTMVPVLLFLSPTYSV